MRFLIYYKCILWLIGGCMGKNSENVTPRVNFTLVSVSSQDKYRHVVRMGIWTTRTQDNSYPGQLVPKTTRTHELSWVRVVLGTTCPGYELSWVRVVLGTSCLGYELSIIRQNVLSIPWQKFAHGLGTTSVAWISDLYTVNQAWNSI